MLVWDQALLGQHSSCIQAKALDHLRVPLPTVALLPAPPVLKAVPADEA